MTKGASGTDSEDGDSNVDYDNVDVMEDRTLTLVRRWISQKVS